MSLINTKVLPPGITEHNKLVTESTAYYRMIPYPYYGFQSWKTEDLGPYPKCLPIPPAIINRSAVWLFGKPINFEFPHSTKIEQELIRAWKANKMQSRLVNLAKKGGREGGVTLKYSYNSKNIDRPINIQVLSSCTQVKYFLNPHDEDDVLMVRVQYPFQDPNDGKFYWYREEWTSTEEVYYFPVEIVGFGLNQTNPFQFTGTPLFPNIDTNTEWIIKQRKVNKLGLIPIHHIKNIEDDTQYGAGDMFGLFKILDRINLTYHLMDRSNQLDVDPRTILIDLAPKEGDAADMPLAPGGVSDYQSEVDETTGQVKTGKVEFLENSGKMREHLMTYADAMTQQLYDATGAVFPRQEHVTNKGSLTQSVLIQMYAPLLEITQEKRKTYGDNGIAHFLKLIVLGLGRMGIKPFDEMKTSASLYDEKLEVNLNWFNQFERTEDEKFSIFDRLDNEVKSHFIKPETAIRKIAQLEETPISDEDLQKLIGEVDEQLELLDEQVIASTRTEQGNGTETKSGSGSTRNSNNPANKRDNRQNKQRKQQQRGKDVKDAN